MNWKILGVGALVVVPMVWLLAEGFGHDPRALPNVLEGKEAPGFALQTLEGDPVSLESVRGSPVVLNFWATWCVPCLQEHPVLLEAARRYQGRGVVFLGVLYGDEAADANAYLKKHGKAFPTLLDPAQRTAIDYGVGGVPETFFIDRSGQIVRKVSGPVSPDVMVSTLEEML